MRRLVFVAALALVTRSTGANSAAWFVPGLANITGRNATHFSSDLKVLNRGTAATTVTFEITLLSGEVSPAPATRAVAPGETLVFTNALRDLWALSEKAGTVRITADQPLAIGARTYNDADPSGTYGTALEAVADAQLLRAGEVGHAPWISESPDPAKAFRTNVGAFLAVPGSSIDIVLFDASGKEVGRTTATGGPLAFQTSVSSIAPGGLTVGRAEFWVRAGKATGYAAVVDNVTGDGIAVQTRRGLPGGTTTNVVINGVAHSPGREGTYFQTDVRLFNPGATAATVKVNALSLGSVPQATIALAPLETKEIPDVLAALFNLPDGSAGALQFVALGYPVMVLARTSNVHRDGTPGTFGAFQASADTFSLPAVGTTATLIGLRQTSDKPGYRTNVGFLGGPNTGGTARLVLRGRTGQVLAAVDGAVSLPTYGWVQKGLGELFPGVTIPDDSSLDVVVTAGSLDTFSSVIDNVTGDPVVSRAALAVPYSCDPPEIYSFFSSPDSLAGPGTATLHWFSDADSVGITAGGSALPGSGTVALDATASGTYILTARNSCGVTTSSLTLTVGPAGAPAPATPSGAPGQILRLAPRNLPAGATVTGVVFRFADGYTLVNPPARVLADGTVVVVVPFPADPTAPEGYRQGNATVALEVDRDTVTPGSAFRFDPLASVADPVGRMRTWIDTITNASRAALANVTTLDGGDAALPVLNAALDTLSGTLRKMASDIEATGSATLPVAEPVAGSTAPANGTVTKAQLGLLVAFLDNLSASSVSLASAGARAPLASPPCVKETDLPGREIKFCMGAVYVANLFDPSGLWIGNLNLIVAGFDLVACVLPIASIGFLATVDRIINVIQLPQAICPLLPVWFKYFDATPSKVEAGLPSQIQLAVNLGTLANQSQFISYLANKAIEQLTEREMEYAPEGCRRAVNNALSQYVQDAAGFLQSVLNRALTALRFPTGVAGYRLPVGSCDLYDVIAGTKLLKKTQKGCENGEGQPYYCFQGNFPGGYSKLLVRTNQDKLLFGTLQNGYFSPFLGDSRDREPDVVPILVGAAPQLGLGNIHFTVGPGDTSPLDLGVLLPGLPLQFQMRGLEATLVRVRGRAYDPKTYEIDLDVWGGPAVNTFSAISYQAAGSGFLTGSASKWNLIVTAGGRADVAAPNAQYGYKLSGSILTTLGGRTSFLDDGAQKAFANYRFDTTTSAGESVVVTHALNGGSQAPSDSPPTSRFHFFSQLFLHFDEFPP